MSSDCYKSKCTPETVTDLNNKLIIFFLLFSTFVIRGRMMIKLIPKIGVKLAGKMTIVTQVKNVSDIMINAWLIEASALMR